MRDYLLDSKKFLSAEENEYLATRLKRDDGRDSTILLLLLTYGMRSGELLKLRLKDINLSNRSIMIYGSKDSRSREFPLTKYLFDRLWTEAKKCSSPGSRVFDIGYNRLGDIWRIWRPSDKPLHCLRHSAAIRIYQETKDIQLVQQILGHRYLGNTMIYQQFVYTQDKMRQVFHV